MLLRDEWQECGVFLRSIDKSVQWCIGDWLNEGERRYGDMYTRAMEVTGLSYASLRDAKWASAQFELSRRRDNLDFSHHREVAALPVVQADQILKRAEDEGLSKKEVRQLARRAREAAVEPVQPEVVRVVESLDDAPTALRAKQDENSCREPITSTEAVDLCTRLLALEKKSAKERQRAGGKAGGKASGKLPEASGGQARDKVAKAVGWRGSTFERAKAGC